MACSLSQPLPCSAISYSGCYVQVASGPKTRKSTKLQQKKKKHLAYRCLIAALLHLLPPLQVAFLPLSPGWCWQQGGPCSIKDTCQHGVVGVGGSMAGASSIQLLAALAPSAAAGTPSPVISQPTSAVPCHGGKEALVRMLPGITPLRALPSVLCGD